MKIAVLSNINLDSIIKRIYEKFEVYKLKEHEVWTQEIINSNSALYKFKPEGVFLILDGDEIVTSAKVLNLENKKRIMYKYLNYIENAVSNNTNIKFFISNLDINISHIKDEKSEDIDKILEYSWFQRLNKLKAKYSNAFIFDLKRLIEDNGRKTIYSKKLWHLSRMKFSNKGEEIIKKEIESLSNLLKGKRKKCLILDMDNTFWNKINKGGLVSDYNNGADFKDFQRRIKEIKDTGVLICICSKNDEENINNFFLPHKHMLLKKNDFTSIKFNCNSKVCNIKEICSELNIGIDSVVFIDDNPVERNFVRNHFVSVVVPDLPEEIFRFEEFIVNVYNDYFRILKISTEDLNRTEMYKQNTKRQEQRNEMDSLEGFLKNLEMEITVRRGSNKDALRISQLTQKTNQFNLANKRYTEAEINNLIKNNSYDVFAVEVKDKFGDNGMVAVIIVKRKNQKEVFIDTFLMSCRVMGRRIEEQLIDFIEELYRTKGYEKIFAYYNYSKKNKPVENFYENMGYKIINTDKNGDKFYAEKLIKLLDIKRKIYGKLVWNK